MSNVDLQLNVEVVEIEFEIVLCVMVCREFASALTFALPLY